MRFLRTQFLILSFAGTAIMPSAFAEETPEEYPAPCDPAKMTKADIDRAHTVFLSGKQYLEESNYDKAISYFKDAYTIDCSIHAILPIIATSYERKGDKAAAIRALQEYLKRSPSAPDHEVIERRIKNLTEQLAREPAAAAVPPPPGSAAPSPSVPPVPSASQSTTVPDSPPAAASALSSTQTIDAHPPSKSSNPGPWIVVGLGGAAVVGSVVLYAIGIPDVNSAADKCVTRTSCPVDVANRGNDGRFLEIAGGVVGGIGLAAVGGGLLWYFVSQRNSDPGSAGVTPAISLAPGYAGVTLSDTF